MAGTSDKARFYLEQSIPELHDLERRNVFSKEEIVAIAKKRSTCEYKINSRGSKPADYARYVEFEMNLDSLRRKRASRLAIKAGNYAGQRRILFIIDRATRKFPGDVRLWIQYVDIARQQKAYKKVSQVLTSLVRLHPTKPEVWIYAANYVFQEHADMTEARSYMQRGLRFCKHSQRVWLTYAKMELLYIEKIAARRKILGLDRSPQEQNMNPTSKSHGGDTLALPAITAEDINPHLRSNEKLDGLGQQPPDDTPALSGAIPAAIFTAAMDHFPDENLGAQFFDILSEAGHLPCSDVLAKKMVDHICQMAPESAAAKDTHIRQPLTGIPVLTAEFPRRLGISIERLKTCFEAGSSLALIRKTIDWIVSYLRVELDADTRTVFEITLSDVIGQFQSLCKETKGASPEEIAVLVERIQVLGVENTLASMLSWGLEIWPANGQLLNLQESIANEDVAL